MILKSVKFGFAQMWANKRMVLLYYLANLLFGLILMFPLRSMVSKFVGYSLMGVKLGGYLDMNFLFEFINSNSSNVDSIKGLFLIVPLAYWLFSLFLSGGAFSTFASEQKYSPNLFWGNAAKYFGRFVRLVLWCLPVIAILFCLQFIWSAVERLLFGKDPYQYIVFWGSWIKVGLRYISILLITIVLEYSRIHVVLTEERRMRISLLHGLKFAYRKFFKTFSLVFLLFMFGVIILVIYNPIANALHAPNIVIIFMLLLVQQIYMFFRMMLKLTRFSSEMYLYKSLTPSALKRSA